MGASTPLDKGRAALVAIPDDVQPTLEGALPLPDSGIQPVESGARVLEHRGRGHVLQVQA